jgi:hypothetical protein
MSVAFKMSDPERLLNNRDLMRQIVVAWVVAVWAVAIGVFLHVFHEPIGDGQAVLRQYELPVSSAAESGDLAIPRGTAWLRAQSGSSTAPDPLPEHQQ